MTPELQTTDTQLTIRKTYDASPKKVYAALTQKDLVARWYAPGDMKADVRTFEPRVGGRFQIAMVAPDGAEHVCSGTFTELVPDKRVAHTWNWAEMPVQNDESVVTIDLDDKNGKTELVLTHTKLSNKESVESHTQGWMGCLENLAKVL